MTRHTSQVRAVRALISMKTRLIWNTLRARQGFWSLLVILLFALVWCMFAAREAASATRFLSTLFLVEPVRQLLAAAIAYAFLIVFTSDILMGHTLNAGQMSTDAPFLSTLPASPGSLLAVKLYERLITDWVGFIFLFSGFLGLAWPGHLTPGWLILCILLYIELETLAGLAITLIGAAMQRFFRPAAISNMFSLLGYACAFAGLVPLLIISSAPLESATALLTSMNSYGGIVGPVIAPFRWLTDSLLDGFSSPSFASLQLLWAGALAAGAGLFRLMLRLDWLTWVHPGRRREMSNSRHLLSGLLRKETVLLRSDWNILTNSLLLPISIIVMQLWVFRNILATNPEAHGMNILAAALMYFSMFGPLNSIGSEGKAVSLLETLPVSPGRIIGLKTLFWSFLAAACFIPSAIAIGIYLAIPSLSILRITLWTLLIIPPLIWVTISMSAIHARYEGKILQQRSHLAAKLLTPLLLGLLVAAKDLSPDSLINLAVFLMLAWSLHARAVDAMARRLDPEGLLQPRFRIADAVLFVSILFGIRRFIVTIAAIAVPPEAHGLWPWLFSLLIGTGALAYLCLEYVRSRFSSPAKALGLQSCSPVAAAEVIVFAGLLAGLIPRWLEFVDAAGLGVFAAAADVRTVACAFLGYHTSTALLAILFCGIIPFVGEVFFRGFLCQALAGRGWAGTAGIMVSGVVFALQYHPALMLPAAVLGMAAAFLYQQTKSLWPGIALHIISNIIMLSIIYYHIS